MISAPVYVDITFHDHATTAGEGTHFQTDTYTTLNVWTEGTASNHTIAFFEKDPFGHLKPIAGMRSDVTNPALAVSTTGIGEVWQFDIIGKREIIMSLTSVSGGYVSVFGRAIK